MAVETYRKLSTKQLIERITKQKEKLANIRLELNAGKEKDYSQLRKIRLEVARLLTVLNDKKFIESKEEDKSSTKDTKEVPKKKIKKDSKNEKGKESNKKKKTVEKKEKKNLKKKK